MVLSVKLRADRRLQHERRTRDAVEQELSKFREYCTEQEKEIALLQAVLRKHGIMFDVVERPIAASTISVVVEVNEVGERVVGGAISERPDPPTSMDVCG